LRDSLELIRKRRIRIIRKRTNSLPARHAIGNTKANAISKQKRYLRINLLRPRNACRNKLMSIRPIGISPWSSPILRNQLNHRNLARKRKKRESSLTN
jgi:hypothetical protein